jgi:hypothetical protein
MHSVKITDILCMELLDSYGVWQQFFPIILHQHTITIVITYLTLKCVGMLNSRSIKQINKFYESCTCNTGMTPQRI